jgi:hypothetical protein
MQIVGFNFSKISAEKKKEPVGKIEVKSNIDLKSVETEKMDMIKDKEVLKFNFNFSINYEPAIANLLFEGKVLIMFEKEAAKEVLKRWKTKKLEDEVRIPLYNLILTRCNIKSLQLEEEFLLPTHIPLPKIRPENSKGYVQ